MKSSIPLRDYRDLTLREFFSRYDTQKFKMLHSLLDEKAQSKLDKNNLSPSAGISIGFLVQQDNLKPQVFFLATNDARKRGLRLSLNGTADKNDDSFHDCRLREFSEEMYHHPFIEKLISRLPAPDSNAYLYSATDKTSLSRLAAGKFMYYSEQAFYIDRAKIYSLKELHQTLITPLNMAMKKYGEMTNDKNGNNIFATFMFGKSETAEQINQLKQAVKQLSNWNQYDGRPFTEIDINVLTELNFRLDTYTLNNAEQKIRIKKLMEASVMKYSEAYGVLLLSTDQIKDRLSMNEKESGIFSANYDTLKAVTTSNSDDLSPFDQLAENAIKTVQKNKQRFNFSKSSEEEAEEQNRLSFSS